MRIWILLLVLVAALIGVNEWVNKTPTKPERVDIVNKDEVKEFQPKAKLKPGSVVSLETSKGVIEYVLLEKDCPKTTKRIAELVKKGAYDGVKFPRVEKDILIQSEEAKIKVKPMKRELLQNLGNSKGAVGMARTNDPDSATSVIYILIEPQPQLDGKYTVFGRVISGMDVVTKIEKGDNIEKATIRRLTPEDEKKFNKVLRIESERRTQ